MLKSSTAWTIFWAPPSFSWMPTASTGTVLLINYQAQHLLRARGVSSTSFLALPINLPLSGAQHKQQRIRCSGQVGSSFIASAEVLPGCRTAQKQEKSNAVSLKLCSLLMHSPAAGRCQPCCFLLSGAPFRPTFILNFCLLSLLLREFAHYLTHTSPHQTHQFFLTSTVQFS